MQKEIAAYLGISRRHIGRIMTGEGNASQKTARLLERKTGIDKEVFVFGSAAKRQAEWQKFIAEFASEPPLQETHQGEGA